MVTDQFLTVVPEDSIMWFKERKQEFLQQDMELADVYTLARGTGRVSSHKSQVGAANSTWGWLDATKVPFQPITLLIEGCMQIIYKSEKRGAFSLRSTDTTYLTAQARVHQLLLKQAAKWVCALCCALCMMLEWACILGSYSSITGWGVSPFIL